MASKYCEYPEVPKYINAPRLFIEGVIESICTILSNICVLCPDYPEN